MLRPPPISTRPDPLVPYTTLFRSVLRRPEPQQYIGALDRRLRPVDPDRLDRIGTLPTNPSRVRKAHRDPVERERGRSEEHTSELQSLMRRSYAVFCLKKKTTTQFT